MLLVMLLFDAFAYQAAEEAVYQSINQSMLHL
jgi:hypothetical protein